MHNTITPIARKKNGTYILDLVLRCNITSTEHPYGVFHPHEELHHIKKENIGLIEIMGLAILPPRLQAELEIVANMLVNGGNAEEYPDIASHVAWAKQIAKRHPDIDASSARRIIQDEVAQVFSQALEDTGVFKWDASGRKALERFLSAL